MLALGACHCEKDNILLRSQAVQGPGTSTLCLPAHMLFVSHRPWTVLSAGACEIVLIHDI